MARKNMTLFVKGKNKQIKIVTHVLERHKSYKHNQVEIFTHVADAFCTNTTNLLS